MLALAAFAVTAGTVPASAASARSTSPAAAQARPHVIHPSGRVHAKAARVVSFRSRARAWRARHPGASATGGMISPRAANTTAFNGISQHDCTVSGCLPLPVAATGPNGAQIIEADDQFIKVFDKTGAALCGGGMTLNAFFGGTGIRFPQLQYDDVSNQFIVEAANAGTAPATIYLAATTGHDACGHWHIYTITVGSPADSIGGVFDAGQDARAVLLSLPLGGPDRPGSQILAIPKAEIFAGTPLTTASFTIPNTADTDNPTPVTAAGNPTINSPNTYFLNTKGVTASGYLLYTMLGSGSSTPTLTAQSIGGPFPRVGRFEDFISSAEFDGSRIWFTHGVGSPAQDGSALWRYGYIKVADNSFTTTDLGATGGPLELNGSIAVSPNADGTVTVFLAWMSVDRAQTQALGFVKSFIYPGSGPLPGTTSSDQNVAVSTGPPELETVTTASIDPGTANGTCAVTTHPNWLNDGTWTTLVRRKCGATPPVQMPSVTGDSDTAAISAVQAAGLVPSVTTIEPPTGDCSILTSDTIVDQDPQPGAAVSAGATVSLTFCGFAF